MDKRKALGRGLGALIPSVARAESESVAEHQVPAGGPTPAFAPASSGSALKAATMRREFFMCPIEEVVPSRDNPRQRFDEQRLQELADSIRTQGLVQPLVVRLRTAEEQKQSEQGPSFILIAGERRWRAAQRAGLKDVPVVVKDVSAAQAFELALVENLQREDLNPIEEAEAYRRLSDEFGYTQEQLASRVGRERSTVANALRLLHLPDKVRTYVIEGALSMGHARSLLGIDDHAQMEDKAKQIIDKQLSVRQTEELVRRAKKEQERAEESPKKPSKPESRSAAIRDVEDRLQKALGTRVQLRAKDDRAGVVEVHYHSLDELDRLIQLFTGESSDS